MNNAIAIVMMLMVLGALCTTASAGQHGAGCPFSNWYNGTVHGGIYFEIHGHYDEAGATQTYTFENVPDGRKIVRLYPGIWLGSPSSGRVTNWSLTINGNLENFSFTEPDSLPFCDWDIPPEDGTGEHCKVSCSGCGVCSVTYNASPCIVTGNSTITYWTSEQIYQVALVVVYENGSMPEMQYWIKEGHEKPDNAPYFVYFNETVNTGPIVPENISSVEYFTYGYPRPLGESGWPSLNGNYIGKPNLTYNNGYDNVSHYWTNISPDYISSPSNQFSYLTLSPNARMMVPILVLKYGTPELPDLVVTDKWVCWPDNCTICYNMTNIGNGTAPACHNTTLYVDGVETAQDKVPVELAPNASYIGCFNYAWTYTPDKDNITVCADKNETVTESDEENNCLTNTWKCGDIDGNGYITMADVGLLWPHVYYPDEYPINEWTGDVDGNGYITMADVGLLWPHVFLPDLYPLNCRCS